MFADEGEDGRGVDGTVRDGVCRGEDDGDGGHDDDDSGGSIYQMMMMSSAAFCPRCDAIGSEEGSIVREICCPWRNESNVGLCYEREREKERESASDRN